MLMVARYEPMEKPDLGVHAVVVVPPPWATSELKPPQKIWGTACVAETWTALQGGGEVE